MPSPAFEIDLLVPRAPEQVWSRLWDLSRHTAAVPLTTVSGEPLHQGARFTARTRVGPVVLDDVMVVQEWDPPHRAQLRKVGRVLRGQIDVELRPAGGDTRLRWVQTYGAPGVPDALAGAVRPGVRAAYLRTLRRITGS